MDISQNAKFALVILEPPAGPVYGKSPQDQWRNFLVNTPSTNPPSEDILRIHDNVWLIPLSNRMPLLMELLARSHSMEIRSRILFLSEKPDWIKCPPDQTPSGSMPQTLEAIHEWNLSQRH
jgi:hypothetical protein